MTSAEQYQQDLENEAKNYAKGASKPMEIRDMRRWRKTGLY